MLDRVSVLASASWKLACACTGTGPGERRHPGGEARGKILEARVAARQPRPRHNIFNDDSRLFGKNTFSNHYSLLILYKGHLHGLS